MKKKIKQFKRWWCKEFGHKYRYFGHNSTDGSFSTTRWCRRCGWRIDEGSDGYSQKYTEL